VKRLPIGLMVAGVLLAAGGGIGLATNGGGGTPVAGGSPGGTSSPSASASPSASPSVSLSPAAESVPDFLATFARAVRRGDAPFLLARLHPAVTDLYGQQQCETFLASIRDRTRAYEVLSMSALMPYVYDPDGRSIQVGDVFSVRVRQTANGTTTTNIIHLGLVDGQIRWFTDCGTPTS
jgi:hypothetical protein